MADSGTYDPETLASRSRIADQLLLQATKPREIRHWAQGLGQMGEAGIAGLLSGLDDRERKEGSKAQAEAIASLLSGGAPASAAPVSAPMPAAAPAPTQDAAAPPPTSDFMPNVGGLPPNAAPMDANAKAIAGIESGGAYDKLGPMTKGDRAYGKYQVMGANVAPWTKAHLGREMTPDQFLADPAAQDAVFKGQFGQYAQKYGPEGAARAWFAGEGGMNNPNARDVLGTSVADYAAKFNKGVGAPQPSPVAAALAQQPQVAQAAQNAPEGVFVAGASPMAAKIAKMLNDPNPYVRKTGMALGQNLIQKQLESENPSYGFQTLPDGTIIRTNPKTGQVQPIYQAATKPTFGQVGEDATGGKQYGFINPNNRTVEPYKPQGSGQPVIINDANGNPLTVPQGQDPKKFREHVTANTADAMSGKLTEAQTNATQFANRMEDAEKNLAPVANEAGGISGAAQQVAGKVPVIGSAMQSERYQKFDQAKSQFVTAMLRKESGAAISKSEFERYEKEFFPMPGDKPDVIAQKANARRVAIDAMKKGAGPMYKSPDATPVEKSIGGKTYFQKDGQWYEK